MESEQIGAYSAQRGFGRGRSLACLLWDDSSWWMCNAELIIPAATEASACGVHSTRPQTLAPQAMDFFPSADSLQGLPYAELWQVARGQG